MMVPQLPRDETTLWGAESPIASLWDGRTRGGTGQGNETAREGETFQFETE